MRIQQIPTPVLGGPSNGGSVSLQPVLGTGPKGDKGDQGNSVTGPQGPPGPGTGAGAWQATTAYTANQVVQAPDGSMISRNSTGTSRASFDATEEAAWTSVASKAGTVAQKALNASLVPKWQPNTPYVTGDIRMAPDGSIVERTSNGTSGSTYSGTNWKPATGLARQIATPLTVVRAGSTSAAAPFPNFVVGTTVAWTSQDSGMNTIYWPDVTDCQPLIDAGLTLPARYVAACSTDHAVGSTGDFALSWSNDPLDFKTSTGHTWAQVSATGIPAALVQRETPSVNLDKVGGRLVLTFQAQDSANGNAQDSYVLTSTNGTAWTYLGIVTPFPVTDMGSDQHGGYMPKLTEWGNAYGAYSLAGGTPKGACGFRVTRDFVNWIPIGQQMPFQNAADNINMGGARFFRWRGERWMTFIRGNVADVLETHTYTAWVCKVADDLRTPLSEPVQIMASEANCYPECLLASGGRLYAYYRRGGNTGDIRVAIAEG